MTKTSRVSRDWRLRTGRSRDHAAPSRQHSGPFGLQIGNPITPEDRRMRLPWWAILCVIAGSIPVMSLFDHFGKLALALPAIDASGIVVLAIVLRWKLRRH